MPTRAARIQIFSFVKTGEDKDGKPMLSAIPVTKFQVSKELGHGGTALVERVYGYLGEEQHRSEFVGFVIEHHHETLGDRLQGVSGWLSFCPGLSPLASPLDDR